MTLINAKRWDSKSELLKNLEARHHLLLGDKSEYTNFYYSYDLTHKGTMIRIGLCFQGHGIEPVCVYEPSNFLLWIGFDQTVALIRIDDLNIVFQESFCGPFYEFFFPSDYTEAIIVYELGAMKINTLGSICWSVHTDVVEDFELRKDDIILRTMDGKSFCIPYATGMDSIQKVDN